MTRDIKFLKEKMRGILENLVKNMEENPKDEIMRDVLSEYVERARSAFGDDYVRKFEEYLSKLK